MSSGREISAFGTGNRAHRVGAGKSTAMRRTAPNPSSPGNTKPIHASPVPQSGKGHPGPMRKTETRVEKSGTGKIHKNEFRAFGGQIDAANRARSKRRDDD